MLIQITSMHIWFAPTHLTATATLYWSTWYFQKTESPINICTSLTAIPQANFTGLHSRHSDLCFLHFPRLIALLQNQSTNASSKAAAWSLSILKIACCYLTKSYANQTDSILPTVLAVAFAHRHNHLLCCISSVIVKHESDKENKFY